MPAYSKLACLAPLAMAAGAEAFVPAPAAVPSLRGSSVAAVAPKNLGLRVGAKSRGLASLNMVTTLPPGVPGFTTMQKGYFDPTGFDVLKEFEKFAEEAGIEGMDSVLEKLEAQESERMLSIAQSNFKRWNDALQTKDPKKVAELYSSGELSFLPTVSPKHITDTKDTEQYFVNFVLKNPFGTITDESVQAYGPAGDAYLHSGMYTFELGDAGARTPVQARFSYVWQKQGNEWKISHHHSSVRPPVPVSAEEWTSLAQTNFKKWNDSLQTKDPKKVAALYSDSALSFLPTVSPKHITDTKDTEQYFVNFVLKNPFGTITDESVQPFGSDAYLHSGQYTFELGDAGARTPVEARFSYVWKKVGDEWKISHHHSSVRPPTPVSQEEMTKTAQENFKKWNDSLQTKDPKKVAALYSDSALSFLPTVSPKHITDTKDTEQYFVNFVLKNPFGTITDESVQAYGSDAYLHSGQYTFELGDAGARTPVEARFSYMWTKSGDEWKIAHHHSSVRPE